MVNRNKKLEIFNKHKDFALFDEILNVNDKLEKMSESVGGVEKIKGKDGKDGIDGKKGKDGKDGKDGKTGKDGKKGDKGKDGKNGIDGLDGDYGLDGKDGVDGLNGEKGDKPDHKWEGTKLFFEKPTGSWGKGVDLLGKGNSTRAIWGSTTNVRVKDDGNLLSENPLKYLNFTGDNIITEYADGGQVNVSVAGNGIGDMLSSVYDPAEGKRQVAFQDELGTAGWSLNGNTIGAKKTLGSIDNFDFGIITNNIERLTVLKDGKVGIGTTNPSQKLDVVGKISLNDGGNSVFVGEGAGLNDDGSDNRNVGIGYRSLYSNTTGSYNTANGHASLYLNTTGANNTANGYASLNYNTTGSYNFGLGYQSGRYIADGATPNETGTYNTFIGADTKALADGDTNEIVIGNSAIGVGSNSVVLGNDSVVTTALKGNVGIGTTSPSEKLDVNGNIKATQFKLSDLNTAPASATDTGTKGEIRVTADAIYICSATDTWVKTDLATF